MKQINRANLNHNKKNIMIKQKIEMRKKPIQRHLPGDDLWRRCPVEWSGEEGEPEPSLTDEEKIGLVAAL